VGESGQHLGAQDTLRRHRRRSERAVEVDHQAVAGWEGKGYRGHRGRRVDRIAQRVLGVAFLLVQTLLISSSTHASPLRYLIASVTRVNDGDSVIAVSTTGAKLRLRLLDIDAPKIAYGKKPGQPYSKEARDHLTRLVQGKTIRVWIYGQDRSKRMVVVLWAGRVNVNLEMVREGLVEVHRDGRCSTDCSELWELKEAQLRARRERRGMWAQEER
jgi:micrococcal nuclease